MGRTLVLIDCLLAKLLGWSGKYTVSAECGSRNCVGCRILCWALDRLWPGHCRHAAEEVGLKPGAS